MDAMKVAMPANDNDHAWELVPVNHVVWYEGGNGLRYFRTNGALGKVAAAICRRRDLDTDQVEIEWFQDENGNKVAAEGFANTYPRWVLVALLVQYEPLLREQKHVIKDVAACWAEAPAERPAAAPAVEPPPLPTGTQERNAAMRKLHAEGVGIEELAERAGLAHSTVKRIVR